jgi:hypothetical protein
MKTVNVHVQVEVLRNRKHMTAMQKMAEPNDPALARIVSFIKDNGRSH